MRTFVLCLTLSGLAFAGRPIFEVPEAGAWDRATMTLGLENDGAEEMKVEKGLTEGLSVEDSAGKALEVKVAPEPGFALAAREGLSRKIDLLRYFPGLTTPGNYLVKWAHPALKEPLQAKLEIVSSYAAVELEDYGTLYLRFYEAQAPEHVKSFKKLAGDNFYNGLKFFRIIKGFMMQTGCPRNEGTGGPGYMLKAEFNTRPHVFGTLSMARQPNSPDTAGSQFFICFGPQPMLDGQYTVFGQLIDGAEVLKRVEREVKVPKGQERPIKAPVMKSVKIYEAPVAKKEGDK